MAARRETAVAAAGFGRSPRSRLARVALQSARALPQVAGGVRGDHGLWATTDEGGLLEGVSAVARPDGRYDVDLHLVAQWPLGSLHSLADEVRRRASAAIERQGLRELLGDLTVSFEDLRGPSEDRAS